MFSFKELKPMPTLNSNRTPESQPTAVQLAFPWGEEQILDNSPAPSTKRKTQRKTSSNKQNQPQIVIVILLDNIA
jgi:hypothetical protein